MADSVLDQLTRDLTDQGKIIEAGWVGLKAMAVPKDAPPVQIEEMRNAFFAGAQHLFSSIMTFLEEGEEPTEADMSRMDQVQAELDAFIKDYMARRLPAKGRA